MRRHDTHARRGRRGGFTLAELLLATGILGIGLVMAAAVFAAGLRQNKTTTDDVVGSMVCQNALAVVRSTWGYPGGLDDGVAHVSEDVGYANLGYPRPHGDPNDDNDAWQEIDNEWHPRTRWSALVFAREANLGDMVLTVVACNKSDPNNIAHAEKITVDIREEAGDDGESIYLMSFDGDDADYVRNGSPIIFVDDPDLPDGAHARIDGVDRSTRLARLRWPSAWDGDVDLNGVEVWVIYEADPTQDEDLQEPADVPDSPAATVYMTRTPVWLE